LSSGRRLIDAFDLLNGWLEGLQRKDFDVEPLTHKGTPFCNVILVAKAI
jgi:hypothetical protein